MRKCGKTVAICGCFAKESHGVEWKWQEVGSQRPSGVQTLCVDCMTLEEPHHLAVGPS